MKVSSVVENSILTIHVHIKVDPTCGKILDMLPRERYVYYLNPMGSIVVLYVVVKIGIGAIA